MASGAWIERQAGTGRAIAARLFARESAAMPRPLTLAIVGRVVGLLAGWRLAILGFAVILDRLGHAQCGVGVPAPWKYSACWDTQPYQIIAASGYDYTPGQPSLIAFFPLYPLLMRYADDLLPGGDVLAGVVVGHLALTAAALYIFSLVRVDFGDLVAWRTLAFLLFFPAAFFFTAAYTEPLMLLAVAGTLYHARRGQWLRAGLFGAVGSATKLAGVVLVVPIVVEQLSQRVGWRRDHRALAGAALAPLGALAYFAYLQTRFGDFRVFFDAQEHWKRASFSPTFLLGVQRLLDGPSVATTFYPPGITPFPTLFLLLDTTLLLLFAVAGVLLWRQARPSYGALLLGACALLGFSGNPQSLNRYLVVFFPAFILLAKLRSEPLRDALSVAFIFGLGMETYFFVNALWAG